MFGRRKRRGNSPPEPDVFFELRAMALDAVTNGLEQPSPDHPEVSGLVVDIPADGGLATLVALTDGTVSMYTTGGGGTIGAGTHAAVAEASQRLLSTVQMNLGLLAEPDDGELPQSGRVRFHVLTPGGHRGAEVPEASFWGEAPHALMPVIAAVQDVMTAVREVPPDT